MKELLVLSGKGGTGKTTVAGALIRLSRAKTFADCDIDAPNLHLIMNKQVEPIKKDFYGMGKAVIDNEKCTKCGVCGKMCRFSAIENFKVNVYDCEGCGVCEAICPSDAVKLKPAIAGEIKLYNTDDTAFSTAKLKMGSGTSGKLVSEVKSVMRNNKKSEFAIIDGSPGIGCPVIASISGVNRVLIVAEPSLSGMSDMERIIQTAQGFRIPVCVCVNKFDINKAITGNIQRFCKNNNIPFIGKIPYDKKAVNAVNNGKTIVDIECEAGNAVKGVYDKIIILMND